MPKASSSRGGVTSDLSGLIALVKAYVLQETVGPLKRAAKALLLGGAGAVLIGVAAVLSLVALLRALEEETGSAFAGQWNWVPYLLTVVAGVVFLGAAAALTLRGGKGT